MLRMAVNLHFCVCANSPEPSANSPKRLGDLAHSTCINKGYRGLTEYFPMSSWSNLVESMTKLLVNV